MAVRGHQLPTSDDIWQRLWKRIQSRIQAAGGLRRGGRHSGPEGDCVPVDPNRPKTLSGGAAAPLDHDD